MILNYVFAIWTRSIRFRLKIFNRSVKTAFYAFGKEKSTRVFSKQFLFPNGYRAMSRKFSIFGRTFPRGCQRCTLHFRGNISKKIYFFLEYSRKIFFSSETGQKMLSFLNQKVSWVILKTALFLSRRTIWLKGFCLENVNFRSFFGLWARKFRQSYQEIGLRWQNNNWGKWFSLRLIWFSKFFSHFDQKFSDFGFSGKMSILPFPPQDEQLPETHFRFKKTESRNLI